MLRQTVAVIGPGTGASDELCAIAYEIGLLLGRRGTVVVNGGLGGVMEAAARGARDADGQVLGLLPGPDRTGANPHLTVALPTGLGQARNALVISAADAVIAVGGSWGTLSEIALARRSGKPLICLRGWQITDADGQPVPLDRADSPEQAVAWIAGTAST